MKFFFMSRGEQKILPLVSCYQSQCSIHLKNMYLTEASILHFKIESVEITISY